MIITILHSLLKLDDYNNPTELLKLDDYNNPTEPFKI